MLLAVVDMQHSLHVLIMAVKRAPDHLCGFFCMISSVTAQPCYRVCLFFLQLLPRLITLEFQVIALEFLIKQILQPAGTPPFLQNLVASPVRHAELEHEDH